LSTWGVKSRHLMVIDNQYVEANEKHEQIFTIQGTKTPTIRSNRWTDGFCCRTSENVDINV